MPSTALRLCLSLALAAACSNDPQPGLVGIRTQVAGDTIVAPYGALEPRIVALDAFAGRRAPVALRMERTTVEGVLITYTLAVGTGQAVLTIDERLDGGGVRTSTLSALQLVRYVDSRWVNDVEVEKERLEPVTDPAAARGTPGTYLLVHPRCLTAPCPEVF